MQKYPVGEADAMLVVYTKEYGKISIFAQGVRKSAAKLKGHIELLNHVSLGIVAGANTERLVHANTIRWWPEIRRVLEKTKSARVITSFVATHVFPAEREDMLWQALEDAFIALEHGEETQAACAEIVNKFRRSASSILGHGDSLEIFSSNA